jgi:hypothetical protein
MSENDKPFTVSDRRHFTPEGQPRDEGEDQGQAEGGRASETSPSPQPGAGAPGEAGAESASQKPSAGAMDFRQFLLSFGAQAGALLAGQGLPEGAEPAEALEGVRSIIAILEMLKDKTEGRRTSDEDALVEGLLFELRMGYVERTRERTP